MKAKVAPVEIHRMAAGLAEEVGIRVLLAVEVDEVVVEVVVGLAGTVAEADGLKLPTVPLYPGLTRWWAYSFPFQSRVPPGTEDVRVWVFTPLLYYFIMAKESTGSSQ